VTAQAPKGINELEKIRLWVRAGGRCQLCNAYLLEDELTMLTVNLGELAHNVGRKQSAASPRGLDLLPIDQRNLAENLLLLCAMHHKVIDDKVARGEFTVDELRRIKARHEDRIRYLTGLGEDAQTVVLRVVGDIRGGAVELSEQTVRSAVLANGNRYPFFGLGYRGAGIEIDLRGLPAEGKKAYWAEAERRIADVVDRQLRDGINRGEVTHVSVFAFARIPLLALLGHHLDDKVNVELYQRHRGSEGWNWDPTAAPVEFETARVRAGDGSRVALVASISGSVSLSRLPTELDQATVYEIRPLGRVADRDVFAARASLDAFTSCYHRFLSELEREHPSTETLDVIPAVPLTAAVALGRGRMRHVHPVLRIYDRADDGGYALALEIGT
jgi:hypothetical protein